mmetsp:Transcript_71363/g.204746  ORF Transcript_71363/g.204746 Transcript_71363/m.204746 type:complete len:461 (+) Transcript_71363:276-1658(+)
MLHSCRLECQQSVAALLAQSREDQRPQASLVEAMRAREDIKALLHGRDATDLARLILLDRDSAFLRLLEILFERLQRALMVVHLLAHRLDLILVLIQALADLGLEGADGHGVRHVRQHVPNAQLLGLADEARDDLHVAARDLVLHDAEPELLPQPRVRRLAGVLLGEADVALLQSDVNGLLMHAHDTVQKNRGARKAFLGADSQSETRVQQRVALLLCEKFDELILGPARNRHGSLRRRLRGPRGCAGGGLLFGLGIHAVAGEEHHRGIQHSRPRGPTATSWSRAGAAQEILHSACDEVIVWEKAASPDRRHRGRAFPTTCCCLATLADQLRVVLHDMLQIAQRLCTMRRRRSGQVDRGKDRQWVNLLQLRPQQQRYKCARLSTEKDRCESANEVLAGSIRLKVSKLVNRAHAIPATYMVDNDSIEVSSRFCKVCQLVKPTVRLQQMIQRLVNVQVLAIS